MCTYESMRHWKLFKDHSLTAPLSRYKIWLHASLIFGTSLFKAMDDDKERLHTLLLELFSQLDFSNIHGFPNHCYDHEKLFMLLQSYMETMVIRPPIILFLSSNWWLILIFITTMIWWPHLLGPWRGMQGIGFVSFMTNP